MGHSLVIIAMGLLLLWVAASHRESEFDGDVGHATATVYQLYIPKSGILMNNQLLNWMFPAYTVKFSYLSGNDGFVGGETRVSAESFRNLSLHQVIPIKFLFQDPSSTEIDWPSERNRRSQNTKVFFELACCLGCWAAS